MLTDAELLAVYGPRQRVASCWCCRFLACWGIDTPGYRGGGRPELCERCESQEVAGMDPGENREARG